MWNMAFLSKQTIADADPILNRVSVFQRAATNGPLAIMTIYSWFLLFPLLLTHSASAQIAQPARWEEENEFTEDAYSVISLKEEGLALIRDKDKFKDGKKLWDLVILDTALQKKWATEFLLQSEMRFTGYEYIPGKVNFMFRRNETNALNVEMVTIDLASQLIRYTKTEVNLQLRLTHYTVVDGNCIFGGYVGSEPVLIIYDPIKNHNLIVPGFFLTDTELLDVRPNKNNTFNILLSQRTQGRKKIIFRTFDKMGNILVEDEIPIDEDKIILSGLSSVLEHDEVFISGSYAFKTSKQASGIFSCLIDPFSEQPVQFTEFYQLRHFLDYLSDKKAGKIREKAIERSNYGKPPEFKTNVGIHRIEEFKGGFAVFGESYLISSGGSSNTPSSPYYNPTARGYGSPYASTPFSNRYYSNPYLFPSGGGYEEMRMVEGFVVGFDFKGKRLWDYSIPMDEFKIAGRDQVSDFTVVGGIPHFLFKDENELKYANHDTDTTSVSEAKSIPIKLKSELEESKSTDDAEGHVRHWYGPYFYVWGTQSVKQPRRKDVSPNRRVFFINKIQVD